MVKDYDCGPTGAKRSLEEVAFENHGFHQNEYDLLRRFEQYEITRNKQKELLPRFMMEPSRSASRLSRHGYLVSSDRPNRYMLSGKARDLLSKIGKED